MEESEPYEPDQEETGHKVYEVLLKKMFDKLKFHLMLKFDNDSYNVSLSDGLASDAVILNGDIVSIKIKTLVFSNFITSRKGDDFRQLMEHCLRQVPRMQVTLTHQPPANVLMFDDEKRRFVKVTQQQYDKLNPKHPYEKEIHYSMDVRTTAIHWKSGVVVREVGSTSESSHNNARRKILRLLNDPEIYNRSDDKFMLVENHDDIIHDYLIQSKVFSKAEIHYIITQLNKELL